MSPRWASVGNAGLYLYPEEPHRRPHIDVRGPGWNVTLDIRTGEELARSGQVDRATLDDAKDLLAEHRELAEAAFSALLDHRWVGSLDDQLEDRDG